MTELLFLLASIVLILVCGIFVAAEFSFVTVSRRQVERLAAKGDHQAQGILHGLKNLSTQLSGAQIGITITNLAIGLLAEPAVASFVEGPLALIGIPDPLITSVAVTLAIILASAATMVFGELIPKNLAITRPLETARFVQSTQRRFTWLMHYPILFLNGTANAILRKFNIDPREELASARSGEELLAVVKYSAESGTLPEETARMLQRSFKFGDRNVADVATPRVKLITIGIDNTVSDVIKLARHSGHSRFPVVGDSIDRVAGIVHIKNAVKVPYDERRSVLVKTIMEPALIVPSSVDLDSFMEKIQADKMQMAVIIDEYGGTDGVVTMEDIVEELVGEVRDEHDRSGARIRPLNDTSWSLSGLLRPDEVNEATGIVIPEDDDFETMGGLLLDEFEEVPDAGDFFYIDTVNHEAQKRRIKLTVHTMDGNRVDRFMLEVVPVSQQSTEGGQSEIRKVES